MRAVSWFTHRRKTRHPGLRVFLILGLLAAAAGLATVAAVSADTLNDSTRQALLAALDDEREAQATYARAAERYDSGPFVHVVAAEQRHEAHLVDLFAAYGLEVPADAWAEREIELPATAAAACAAAVEWEKANAAMYDGFLAREDLPADVRVVFERLGGMSRERHLPAFQRCAEGRTGGAMHGGGMAGGRHGRAAARKGGDHGAGCPGMAAGAQDAHGVAGATGKCAGGRHGKDGCAGQCGGGCKGHCAAADDAASPDCARSADAAPEAGSKPAEDPAGGSPNVAPDAVAPDAVAPTSGAFCPRPTV